MTEEEVVIQKYLPRIKVSNAEELDAWIQDRKKNWPSDKNVKKKLEAQSLRQGKTSIETTKPSLGLVDYNNSGTESEIEDIKEKVGNNIDELNLELDLKVNSEDGISLIKESETKKQRQDNEVISSDEAPEEQSILRKEIRTKGNKKENKNKIKLDKPIIKKRNHKHGDLYSMLQENENLNYAKQLIQYIRGLKECDLLNE
ncbi:hypothetical protein K502DRAFT_324103 [Neoconidiobolus thromboides FSU 785]|nr:hypothetical protein K502DRAFT_324103 [Neoconidiobolus thromboides FSU 785]